MNRLIILCLIGLIAAIIVIVNFRLWKMPFGPAHRQTYTIDIPAILGTLKYVRAVPQDGMSIAMHGQASFVSDDEPDLDTKLTLARRIGVCMVTAVGKTEDHRQLLNDYSPIVSEVMASDVDKNLNITLVGFQITKLEVGENLAQRLLSERAQAQVRAQATIQSLYTDRSLDELSFAELMELGSAYKTNLQFLEARSVFMSALIRQPLDSQANIWAYLTSELAKVDTPELLAMVDRCLEQSIPPAAFWHYWKASVHCRMAVDVDDRTGEYQITEAAVYGRAWDSLRYAVELEPDLDDLILKYYLPMREQDFPVMYHDPAFERLTGQGPPKAWLRK